MCWYAWYSSSNQTLTASGRGKDYPIHGNSALVSNHVFMMGQSAELNISFLYNNNTLMSSNGYFKFYFFSSYDDLLKCKNSDISSTGTNCPCYFFVNDQSRSPSFSYANGSYSTSIVCEGKPFEGQHYFLSRFICEDSKCDSLNYTNLLVTFTFLYSTAGVLDPSRLPFRGQKCNHNNKYEYECGISYGSFFEAGRSLCTYLTFNTSSNAPELDSRFRDIIPVSITERRRNDVIIFIVSVMLLAIVLILLAYCVPCKLVKITKVGLRSAVAHRLYEALN